MLEWVTENVKLVKEKWFYEKFPQCADRYKEYKKQVEVFRYASDEELMVHNDKGGTTVRVTRPKALFLNLFEEYVWLEPFVEKALKLKKEEDEKKELIRLREMYEDQLTMGRISQEKFDLLKKNGWDRSKLFRGAKGKWHAY
jgi:hypothetical protein